jgi:hypothetical protein
MPPRHCGGSSPATVDSRGDVKRDRAPWLSPTRDERRRSGGRRAAPRKHNDWRPDAMKERNKQLVAAGAAGISISASPTAYSQSPSRDSAAPGQMRPHPQPTRLRPDGVTRTAGTRQGLNPLVGSTLELIGYDAAYTLTPVPAAVRVHHVRHVAIGHGLSGRPRSGPAPPSR